LSSPQRVRGALTPYTQPVPSQLAVAQPLFLAGTQRIISSLWPSSLQVISAPLLHMRAPGRQLLQRRLSLSQPFCPQLCISAKSEPSALQVLSAPRSELQATAFG
jgi:hypothetical protein